MKKEMIDTDQYAKMTAELDKILMKELRITSRAERRKNKIRKIINLEKHIH